MRGQGRQKMKGGPSLGGDGGGNDARGGGVEGTDNLPGNQKHPLLNELVMEVLFKQYTLLNHDDSTKSALARLAKLREVCKAWNQEIRKILLKETRINIKRLISSYPKGLGWEVTTTEDQDNTGFNYSAPMPKEIGPFENLDVKIKSCQDFSNTSVIEWFQLMGSSVKSLQLTCTLKCYHQNRFIEKVLKEWCPNLVSFTLGGAQCYESLIQNSYFAEASLDNQCSSLEEVVLCGEKVYRDSESKSCNLRVNQLEGTTGGPSQSREQVRHRIESERQLMLFIQFVMTYLHQAGNEEGLFSDQDYELGQLEWLVRRPVGLTSLDGMEPRTFGSHVAGFFQEHFSCDPGYESDGGIFGQLMRMSRVKRFVIKEPRLDSTSFFDFLAAMLFFRRNFWRESLESFECVGNCPMISITNGIGPKNIFSKLGLPLKKIKLGDVILQEFVRIQERSFQRMLRGYAESLEELEIKLKTVRMRSSDTPCEFPGLPKLKVLLVECEGGYRVVKVTISDVLEKFPRLERCELKLGLKGEGRLNPFFGNGKGDVVGGRGMEWGNFGSHPLKELKVLDEYVDGKGIERVVTWFPNLKKVELSIVRESEGSFQTFWERMKELPLEKVKVSFAARVGRRGTGLWEKAIGDNAGEFKDLEWLELVHEAGQPFPLTSGFSKEFGKMKKLRFLKFANFEMIFHGQLTEAQEIKENLANIVVDYAGVRTSERLKRNLLMSIKKSV